MSELKQITIKCNECRDVLGKDYEPAKLFESLEEARKFGKDYGWIENNNIDMCRTCINKKDDSE